MIKRILSSLIFILYSSILFSQEVDQKPLIGQKTEELEGIFKVKTNNGERTYIGTCFIVEYNENKYLVSVYHNFDTEGELYFYNYSGNLDIKILERNEDKNVDIIIFKVETDIKGLKLGNNEYTPYFNQFKDYYFTIYGYLSDLGFRKVDGNKLSSIAFSDGFSRYLSDSEIEEGMSGGPWINENNEVIGVNYPRINPWACK